MSVGGRFLQCADMDWGDNNNESVTTKWPDGVEYFWFDSKHGSLRLAPEGEGKKWGSELQSSEGKWAEEFEGFVGKFCWD